MDDILRRLMSSHVSSVYTKEYIFQEDVIFENHMIKYFLFNYPIRLLPEIIHTTLSPVLVELNDISSRSKRLPFLESAMIYKSL